VRQTFDAQSREISTSLQHGRLAASCVWNRDHVARQSPAQILIVGLAPTILTRWGGHQDMAVWSDAMRLVARLLNLPTICDASLKLTYDCGRGRSKLCTTEVNRLCGHRSTIYRLLARHQLTYKKAHFRGKRTDAGKLIAFESAVGAVPVSGFVSLDEASFDTHMTLLYGWSTKGTKCVFYPRHSKRACACVPACCGCVQ
jgi:hypothetical protein